MSFYESSVLPRLLDVACGSKGFLRWREKTAAGLTGTVLEVGFGSGANLSVFPTDVAEVLAVEPSATAMRIAQRRIRASGVRVLHVGLDGQRIELDDASCDSALCTFTLCTIPDATAALLEVRRVLRPGGQLHVLEHGVAPDESVVAWQRRLEPLQRALFGGCHLTRDPLALLEDAGFEPGATTQRYGKGPKPWTYLTSTVATVKER
ncbi:MAG TPA: class I SAM-dependent methyltransferase [Acidimicrobiales bacterium]|nr:class I SAM-dependent methyltransferase [Acidimicrobiales bacterium]